jgi:2-polyprenyl-6-methoxyphenol hydroxylase-like FAD-dependent oxidoreductase
LNPALDIGIAGCGIAGLAAGSLLARQGHRVTIFDQFPHPAPVGAGLILQPVGQAVLAELNILEKSVTAGTRIVGLLGHEVVRGRKVLDVRYSLKNTSRFGLGIHRASLFNLLYETAVQSGVVITPCSKVTSCRLVGKKPGSDKMQAAVFWSLRENEYEQWRNTSLHAWKEKLIELWPELNLFVQNIQSHDDMVMARYSHGTMRRPFNESVVQIGDSAHCSSPQLGQGANMALLDAMALAESISNNPIPEALFAYVRKRRRHVQLYQMISYVFTPLYQSDSRAVAFLRDWFFAPLSAVPPAPRLLGRLIGGDLIKPIS